eukprot:5361986-Prymnesium_polylepis.2
MVEVPKNAVKVLRLAVAALQPHERHLLNRQPRAHERLDRLDAVGQVDEVLHRGRSGGRHDERRDQG